MTITKLRELVAQVATDGKTLTGEERATLLKEFAEAYKVASEGGRLDRLTALIGEWRRGKGFLSSWLNVPEKLMLTVSELAEAMEAYRHLPPDILKWLDAGDSQSPPEPGEWTQWEQNFEEELADAFIRLADLAEACHINLGEAVCYKMGFNELREHRHGKER